MSPDYRPSPSDPPSRSVPALGVIGESAKKETTSTLRRERIRVWEARGRLPEIRLPAQLVLKLPMEATLWIQVDPARPGDGRQQVENRQLVLPVSSQLVSSDVLRSTAGTIEDGQEHRGDELAIYVVRVIRVEDHGYQALWCAVDELMTAVSDDPVVAADHFLLAEVWSGWTETELGRSSVPAKIEIIPIAALLNGAACNSAVASVRQDAAGTLFGPPSRQLQVWTLWEEARSQGQMRMPLGAGDLIPDLGAWVRLPGGAVTTHATYAADGVIIDPVRAATADSKNRLDDYLGFMRDLNALHEQAQWLDPLSRRNRVLEIIAQLTQRVESQAVRAGVPPFGNR